MDEQVIFNAPLLLPVLTFGLMFYAIFRSSVSKRKGQG